MNSESNIYTTSSSEIHRRRTAFATLIISFFFGVVLSTFDLLVAFPMISIYALTSLALFLIISRVLIFSVLRKIEGTRIILTNIQLERAAGKSSRQYRLDKMTGLWIKRTVKGTIREIRIRLKDKKRVSITGLQDFEAFKRTLQERIRNDAQVREFKEIIDFDHPLFYVFFGFFTGILAASIIRFLTLLDYRALKLIQISIIIFLILMGTYWIFNRPLSRYGIGKPIADYIFGILMLVVSIITICSFFLKVQLP